MASPLPWWGQHEPDAGFSIKHSQISEGNAQYHPDPVISNPSLFNQWRHTSVVVAIMVLSFTPLTPRYLGAKHPPLKWTTMVVVNGLAGGSLG